LKCSSKRGRKKRDTKLSGRPFWRRSHGTAEKEKYVAKSLEGRNLAGVLNSQGGLNLLTPAPGKGNLGNPKAKPEKGRAG